MTSNLLSPWTNIAEPHKDIREERFDPAVFAADLGMVLRDEGPIDYRDPVTFFRKTYLTRGLSSLLLDALRRLGPGSGGQAVLQIQTPFGGGKSHVLIALYHLLRHASEIEHLCSIRDLLEEVGLESVPPCRVAALVGTALDPSEGRRTEEGLTVRTLWGEMAYQLGGAALYEKIRTSDQQQVAPGTDRLMDLFEDLGPTLVLVDEALEYATKVGGVEVGEGTLLGQTLAFFQELSGVAANRPQTMLVGAIPSSYSERFDASAQRAFQQLSKIFGRMEQIRTPVEGVEIYEILRRRLFEDVGEEAQRREVAEQYWECYQRHTADLPRRLRDTTYRERMVRAYPFHPELVDILYERWGSLPNFQRTRGVLRLLALVVSDLYKRDSTAPLIQPAHVNLAEARIRREFVNLVGEAYESVISSDIAGHAAKAPQIDHELGGDYAREHIAQGLATSLFLYSHTGGSDRGAALPQLRLSALHPEMAPALITDALDRLSDRLWYLYSDPKWHFDSVPNLNQILVEREDAVNEEDIRERVRSSLGDIVGRRTFDRIYLWPQEPRDVGDTRHLGLVILDPRWAVGTEDTEGFMRQILRKHGTAFRTFRNTLVFLVADSHGVERMQQAARNLLALEGIATDYVGSNRLTERQGERLNKDLEDARSALPQMIYQAYAQMYVPTVEDGLELSEMGLQLLNRGRSLSQQVWEYLKDRDKLLERLDPHLIRAERWDLWQNVEEDLRVDTLRDYFARYTQLPLLAGDHVLLETIARGIELRLFGYGHRADEVDEFSPLYFGQSIAPQQLEIADTAWLIPPERAQALSLRCLSGRVLDQTGAPMEGVTVRLSPSGQAVTTGDDGRFSFEELSTGRYTLAPSKSGYTFSPTTRSLSLEGEDITGLEFVGEEEVDPVPTYCLQGRIQTATGEDVPEVRVAIDPPVVGEAVTDAQGHYAFHDLREGEYIIRPQKGDRSFEPSEIRVTVTEDVSEKDFVLQGSGAAQTIRISTEIPWEDWIDFYGDVLDPLIGAGGVVELSLDLRAQTDDAFNVELIERLRDRLLRYDEGSEVEGG